MINIQRVCFELSPQATIFPNFLEKPQENKFQIKLLSKHLHNTVQVMHVITSNVYCHQLSLLHSNKQQ